MEGVSRVGSVRNVLRMANPLMVNQRIKYPLRASRRSMQPTLGRLRVTKPLANFAEAFGAVEFPGALMSPQIDQPELRAPKECDCDEQPQAKRLARQPWRDHHAAIVIASSCSILLLIVAARCERFLKRGGETASLGDLLIADQVHQASKTAQFCGPRR